MLSNISLLAETAWVLCPKTSHSGPRTLGSASLRRMTGGNSIELRRLARCSERRVHSSLQQINGRHPGRSCKERKREVNGSKPFLHKLHIKVDFVDLGFCYVSRVLVKMLVIYHLHHGYLMLVFLKGTCLYTPPACTGYPPAGPSSSLPGVPELGRNGWKLMRCLSWCFLSH